MLKLDRRSFMKFAAAVGASVAGVKAIEPEVVKAASVPSVVKPTPNTQVMVGLFKAGPEEVSGGGYARAPLGSMSKAQQVNGVVRTANESEIVFPEPTADWGTVEFARIFAFDIFTGEPAYYDLPLATPRHISEYDNRPTFAPGSIVIELA